MSQLPFVGVFVAVVLVLAVSVGNTLSTRRPAGQRLFAVDTEDAHASSAASVADSWPPSIPYPRSGRQRRIALRRPTSETTPAVESAAARTNRSPASAPLPTTENSSSAVSDVAVVDLVGPDGVNETSRATNLGVGSETPGRRGVTSDVSTGSRSHHPATETSSGNGAGVDIGRLSVPSGSSRAQQLEKADMMSAKTELTGWTPPLAAGEVSIDEVAKSAPVSEPSVGDDGPDSEAKSAYVDPARNEVTPPPSQHDEGRRGRPPPSGSGSISSSPSLSARTGGGEDVLVDMKPDQPQQQEVGNRTSETRKLGGGGGDVAAGVVGNYSEHPPTSSSTSNIGLPTINDSSSSSGPTAFPAGSADLSAARAPSSHPGSSTSTGVNEVNTQGPQPSSAFAASEDPTNSSEKILAPQVSSKSSAGIEDPATLGVQNQDHLAVDIDSNSVAGEQPPDTFLGRTADEDEDVDVEDSSIPEPVSGVGNAEQHTFIKADRIGVASGPRTRNAAKATVKSQAASQRRPGGTPLAKIPAAHTALPKPKPAQQAIPNDSSLRPSGKPAVSTEQSNLVDKSIAAVAQIVSSFSKSDANATRVNLPAVGALSHHLPANQRGAVKTATAGATRTVEVHLSPTNAQLTPPHQVVTAGKNASKEASSNQTKLQEVRTDSATTSTPPPTAAQKTANIIKSGVEKTSAASDLPTLPKSLVELQLGGNGTRSGDQHAAFVSRSPAAPGKTSATFTNGTHGAITKVEEPAENGTATAHQPKEAQKAEVRPDVAVVKAPTATVTEPVSIKAADKEQVPSSVDPASHVEVKHVQKESDKHELNPKPAANPPLIPSPQSTSASTKFGTAQEPSGNGNKAPPEEKHTKGTGTVRIATSEASMDLGLVKTSADLTTSEGNPGRNQSLSQKNAPISNASLSTKETLTIGEGSPANASIASPSQQSKIPSPLLTGATPKGATNASGDQSLIKSSVASEQVGVLNSTKELLATSSTTNLTHGTGTFDLFIPPKPTAQVPQNSLALLPLAPVRSDPIAPKPESVEALAAVPALAPPSDTQSLFQSSNKTSIGQGASLPFFLHLVRRAQELQLYRATTLQKIALAERLNDLARARHDVRGLFGPNFSRLAPQFFQKAGGNSLGLRTKTSLEPSRLTSRRIADPDPSSCVNRVFDASSRSRKYHLSWRHTSETFDWLDARNYCRRSCMEPVSPTSAEENSFVKRVLAHARATEGVTSAWTSGRLCDAKSCAALLKTPAFSSFTWVWAGTRDLISASDEVGFNDWARASFRATQPEDADCLAFASPELRHDGDDGWRWTPSSCRSSRRPVVCEDSHALRAEVGPVLERGLRQLQRLYVLRRTKEFLTNLELASGGRGVVAREAAVAPARWRLLSRRRLGGDPRRDPFAPQLNVLV